MNYLFLTELIFPLLIVIGIAILMLNLFLGIFNDKKND